ncbi:MAG TPA: thiol:disulfide interchange protein DsbA/DsbL, partial [Burkholderiales bacterium]|nr:thiol:disulfide interchange protein DsbA/DsbL [Burkholderiales bacterium]
RKWLANKPKDVEFRYQPAIFRDSWIPGAKLFYALEITGDLPRLHDKVYEAIHLDNINAADEKALTDWVVKQGVDRKKFEDAYRSFAMQGKVAAAQRMSKEYKLTGVPSVVVDGKYLTGPGMAGGPERFTPVLDEVIEKARKERAAAGKK